MACAANVAITWPERPLSKHVNLEEHYASVEHEAHLRRLAEEEVSDDDVAMFQIIATSSIGFAIISFFSFYYMFNLDYGGPADSILYTGLTAGGR